MANITDSSLTFDTEVYEDAVSNIGFDVPDFSTFLVDLSPKDAALIYGLVALALAAGPGALWRFYLRDNIDLNTVGYKFTAYAHFWIWGAVFASWLAAFALPSDSLQETFQTVAWTSIAGPFLFNLIGIYYMWAWGCL